MYSSLVVKLSHFLDISVIIEIIIYKKFLNMTKIIEIGVVFAIILSGINIYLYQKTGSDISEIKSYLIKETDKVSEKDTNENNDNKIIVEDLTASEAKDLVENTWDVDFSPSEGGIPTVTSTKISDTLYNIVAVVPTLDDSVNKERLEGEASYVGGEWVLEETPEKTWSCRTGRGHVDYSTVACQ